MLQAHVLMSVITNAANKTSQAPKLLWLQLDGDKKREGPRRML